MDAITLLQHLNAKTVKILFENRIAEIELNDNEPIGSQIFHDLANDFPCMNCGSTDTKVWNKKDGVCPKCDGDMVCQVVGEIKLTSDAN